MIRCKIASSDILYSLTFDLKANIKKNGDQTWDSTMYIAFVLFEDWYVGQILDVDDTEEVANVLFMQAKEEKKIFVWAENPTKLQVPYPNILCSLNDTIVRRANDYKLDNKPIIKKFKLFLKNNK